MGFRSAITRLSLRFIGAMMLAAIASVAQAGNVYECAFDQECIDNQPCSTRDDLPVRMTRRDTGWVVTISDTLPIAFEDMAGTPEQTIRAVSDEIDPDANALALLSVARDGRAILSIHGYFPDLGVVTHLGTCLPGGG